MVNYSSDGCLTTFAVNLADAFVIKDERSTLICDKHARATPRDQSLGMIDSNPIAAHQDNHIRLKRQLFLETSQSRLKMLACHARNYIK